MAVTEFCQRSLLARRSLDDARFASLVMYVGERPALSGAARISVTQKVFRIVQVVDGKLAGIKLIRPQVFGDDRGFFLESYNAVTYAAAGIDAVFVQDNHSRSIKGTLRGVHYQSRPGQAKLVRVILGRIWDVTVDIRPDSPTFGQWAAVELDDKAREQLFVPIGFAHGFCVLSDVAEVEYKVSAPYDAKAECAISYADPELAIKWPVTQPLLSVRDQQAESFASFRSRAGR